jgi:hypothetical protein
LSEGQKNESMIIQEKVKGNNSMVHSSLLSPFHCNCKRLLSYLWPHTDSCILADIECNLFSVQS